MQHPRPEPRATDGVQLGEHQQPEDLDAEQPLLDEVRSGSREASSAIATSCAPTAARYRRACTCGRYAAPMAASACSSCWSRISAPLRSRGPLSYRRRACARGDHALQRRRRHGRFNGNALRLFGYRREELLSRRPFELSPERQADGRLSTEVAGVYLKAALRGEVPVFEVVAPRQRRSAVSLRSAPCAAAGRAGADSLQRHRYFRAPSVTSERSSAWPTATN